MKKLLIGFIMMMALFAFTACGDSSSASPSDGDSQDQAAGQSAAVSEPSEHNTLSEDPAWDALSINHSNYCRIVFGKLGDYKSKVKNNIKSGDFICMTDSMAYAESVEEAGIIGVMDDDETANTCYVLSDDIIFFPETTSHFFPWTEYLQEIVFDNVSTGYVTDMSYMFAHCEYLESLDLSAFDTTNVTDMERMFEECTALKTLNLSGFDTSNLTNMIAMFADCQSLESIDLSSFNTPNLEELQEAFRNCDSLTELNLSSFDGSKVDTDYSYDTTFASCDNLSKVIVSQSLYDAYSFEDSTLFKNGREVIVK